MVLGFATHTIVDSIRNSLGFKLDVHDDNVISAHRNYQQTCDGLFTDLFSAICSKLDPLHAHALQRAKTNYLSGWLSVMPMERDNFDLAAQEFRDALQFATRSLYSVSLHFVMVVVLLPA